MKKFISIMISAVMILLIPLAAFADFERSNYDYYADFPIKVICGNFATSANRETATANFAIKDTTVYSSFKLDLIFEEDVISYSGSTISVDLYKKYSFRLELNKYDNTKVEYVGYFMFVVDDGIVYCNIDYNLINNSTRSYLYESESNDILYVLCYEGEYAGQNIVNPNIKNITKTDIGYGEVSSGYHDYWKLTVDSNNTTAASIPATVVIQTASDNVIYYWLYRKPKGLIGPGAETLVSQSHFTVSGTMSYGINFVPEQNGTEYEYYIKIATGDGYSHSYNINFFIGETPTFFSQVNAAVGTGYCVDRISSLHSRYNGTLGNLPFYIEGNNTMQTSLSGSACFVTSCAMVLRNLGKTTTKYDYRYPTTYIHGPIIMEADPYSVMLGNALSDGQIAAQNGIGYFNSSIANPINLVYANVANSFNAGSLVPVGPAYRAATETEKIQMLANALAANPEGVILQYPKLGNNPLHYVVLVEDKGAHIEDPNDRFVLIDPGVAAYQNGYKITMGQKTRLNFENLNAYLYFSA